jgi:hypothetical protein
MANRTPSTLDQIPSAEQVRERLSCLLRETRLARRLLPLAEDANRERQRQGVIRQQGGSRNVS